MANFNIRTTASDVVKTFSDRLKGKNVLITGTTIGSIGFQTVKAIASASDIGTLILANRNQSKAKDTIQALREDAPNVDFRSVPLDLASLESIKSAAKTIKAFNLKINLVFLNATPPQTPKLVRTRDGHEQQNGTMNLGHFHLLSLIFRHCLLGAGTISDPARIICMTSGVHKFGAPRFNDPDFRARPEEYDQYESYGTAKSSLMLVGRGISNRYRDQGIMGTWANPGLCVDTSMGSACDREKLVEWGHLRPDGTKVNPDNWKTVQEAAAPGLVCALDPRCLEETVPYVINSQVVQGQAAEWVESDENAERLWKLNEEMLGDTFGQAE